MPSDPSADPPGLAATLRAGLTGGLLGALFFGLVDGPLAWWMGPRVGVLAGVGCVAATVLLYVAVYGTAGLALAVPAHLLLRRRGGQTRFAVLTGLVLGGGLFLEIYWWTRPFVFYGHSSTSPERLAAAGVMLVVGLGLGLLGGWLLARLPAQSHRVFHVALGACVLLGALTMVLDRRASTGSGRGDLNERNQGLPNVLLIVVDALRADVLEPYGSEVVKTPHLKELAANGVVFENALVQAPFTWSSFGSILTGKYPRRHGLVAMSPEFRMRIAQNVTLPWHLKQAERESGGVRLEDGDYAGATFMTGTLSQGSGLMHGFDCYFEAMAGHELVYLDSTWSVFRSNLLLFLVKNKLTQRFDNSLVVTTAVDWLRANEGRRFVAMLHLYSTHTPYDPEEEFRAMYCDPAYDGPIPAFYAEHRLELESGRYEPTDADVEQIRNLYYGGTSQADRDVGIVLDELERSGALENTLVIFTSDHGEELYEHGLWEHNWMYQTNLRIPLILSWPARLPKGKRVSALVETVDLLPTVCELLGLAPPPDKGEYERVDGKSLVPLIDGRVESVKRYSFAENGRFASIQDARTKLIVRAEVLEDEDGWAKVKSGELEKPRFFDLAADPDELVNAFDERPEDVERLFAELSAWSDALPIPRAEVVRSARDAENEELFHALGYTGDTGDADALREGEDRERD